MSHKCPIGCCNVVTDVIRYKRVIFVKLNFAILEILRRYTDPEHTLNQNDIVELLERDFELKADRKSIKRNITSLLEMGYPIEFNETLRRYTGKNGKMEESYILTDFYLEREFTDAELRLLIDSLLFSKHVPRTQCKDLVEKLEGLSNRYFNSRARFIATMPENMPKNKELFYTIEVLDEAIANEKQVAFTYNTYGTDKKLHPRQRELYVVSPYQMAATNGRYYLICKAEQYAYLSNFRLDRITNIRLLDTPVQPVRQAKGQKNGFDLPKHMAEHMYMFSGESVVVTFRMKKEVLNDVLDWFGTEITFSDETDEEVTARVFINWSAMRYWALQYCRHIHILTPQELADTVKEDLQGALERYRG